jgi:hypothetical protein
MMGPQRDNPLSGYCTIPGITTTAPYGLISIHGDGYAPDLLTDGITRCLAREQSRTGTGEMEEASGLSLRRAGFRAQRCRPGP